MPAGPPKTNIEAVEERTTQIEAEIAPTVVVDDVLTRIKRLGGDNSTTTEIMTAIHRAENPDGDECNRELGCLGGIGPMMITQSTFDEQCEGNVYNEDDNLRCGFKMIENEEYWRWNPTMEMWLYKLPPEIRDYVKVRCECLSYVRSKGIDIKNLDIEPNSPPVIGAIILFDYDGVSHVGIL